MLLDKIRNLDRHTKDTLFVFLGASMGNFFNLLYQLFIVRKFSPADFAAFNTLIAILTLLSTPIATLTQSITRYVARFSAKKETDKISITLNLFFRLTFLLGLALFVVLCALNAAMAKAFGIPDALSIFIMSCLIFLLWITPVYSGAVQGLEHFGVFVSATMISGFFKLALVVVFVLIGWGVAGALGAFLVSSLFSLLIFFFSLKKYIFKKTEGRLEEFGEIVRFILPLAATWFCFNSLVNMDMILVKHYFSSLDAGYYSVAQMVGKIFLFLPGPVSIVMFPKTAGLSALEKDTVTILKKLVLFGSLLCVSAAAFYNLFPVFVLKVLTNKTIPTSIALGRLFSVSMSFYALIFILLSYHLSIGDCRFLKFLVISAIAQLVAINLFHGSLFTVQVIMCLNAILLFLVNFRLGLKESPAA
ncbi:MAG: oligosaccharide flippase family protein [Candidatus Omnitrophica bacterium]|nr:oligosaccharide flippase family protein [Candidatus Omnitrophota bacterium]MDD5236887.1 oligosaccharide flippase family protein [Candidatus Omnitrophota bacterium]MDD5610156.1 oligosaccharide flippase family protein [Candidatus Omnitrophota bacterium]